jgi:hypothetical protein
MSYEKITLTIPTIADALEAVAPEAADQSAMLAAASVVQLETDDIAWVCCAAADNPDTVNIEFATVGIAVNADGTIRTRPSGQPIAVAFMHPVVPDVVVSRGRDVIRKDLILIALGETPIHPEDWTAMNTAERSIRTYIAAAAQVAAPQTDVL